MATTARRASSLNFTSPRGRARCGFQAPRPILMICCALIMSGWITIATPATPSLAQSTDTGLHAEKTGVSASKKAAPNRNMNPTKHRHWRHQGGRHPHFGSRRVRT